MLNPWKLYGAIAALVAVLSLVAWVGFTVRGWQRDAHRLPAIVAERDQARAEAAAVRAQADAERIRADTAVRGYLDEVDQIRRRQQPAGPVRLCREPAPAGVPAASPTGSPDAPPAAPRELPGAAGGGPAAGPDIGPDLYALADDADAVVAQCRALQGWLRSAGTP